MGNFGKGWMAVQRGFYGMLALAGVAVLIAGAVWWNRNGGVEIGGGFDNRIELTPQEIRRIEEIGEWEFLSVQTETVADTLRKGFFTDDRLVVIYTGTLRLGIDMQHVKDNWTRVHGDTVTLHLPVVRLLDKHFIDEARTKVFYESGAWTNQARRELYYKAYNSMVRKCLTRENLRQAEGNARQQFATMFHALGFNTVEITFGN